MHLVSSSGTGLASGRVLACYGHGGTFVDFESGGHQMVSDSRTLYLDAANAVSRSSQTSYPSHPCYPTQQPGYATTATTQACPAPVAVAQPVGALPMAYAQPVGTQPMAYAQPVATGPTTFGQPVSS